MASTCVAFGAVLGKISPVQLLIMTFFQVTLFAVNEYIILYLIEVNKTYLEGRETLGEIKRDTEREVCG